LKDKPSVFYLPGEDPGDPDDVAVPLLAGFYALLFLAAPLGGLTCRIHHMNTVSGQLKELVSL